ncbi:hypothetical protein ACGFIF_24965 [Kribbella sp. NPDC049174]|uniref:hypothetical protein n=1 Tax=Kribbella sp. NPDC049174 TaxID=3364112 RepID=UPI00371F3D12
MTERRKDPSIVYDAWKSLLDESGGFIENDGRLPNETLVWTPYGEEDLRNAPASYCQSGWAWYQGRILGQSDTNTWLVFLNHEGLPFLCQRHASDLRQVIPGNGSNS